MMKSRAARKCSHSEAARSVVTISILGFIALMQVYVSDCYVDLVWLLKFRV